MMRLKSKNKYSRYFLLFSPCGIFLFSSFLCCSSVTFLSTSFPYSFLFSFLFLHIFQLKICTYIEHWNWKLKFFSGKMLTMSRLSVDTRWCLHSNHTRSNEIVFYFTPLLASVYIILSWKHAKFNISIWNNFERDEWYYTFQLMRSSHFTL